jgi:vacuolar-type H+-ATPase subunit I/STV1
MTDVKKPSGQPENDLVDQTKEKKDVVAYETYQKTLAQEKNLRAKTQELESELNSLKNAQREAEEAKLNEKGEFKKLVELREQEIEKLREKISFVEKDRDGYKGNLDDTYKLQAFYDKLPGKIKRKEYLGFVDLESIIVDPETGDIDSSSVQNVVSGFIERHGDLIESSKFGGLPADAPMGSSKKFTQSEWKNLSLKEKKESWSRKPAI